MVETLKKKIDTVKENIDCVNSRLIRIENTIDSVKNKEKRVFTAKEDIKYSFFGVCLSTVIIILLILLAIGSTNLTVFLKIYFVLTLIFFIALWALCVAQLVFSIMHLWRTI